MTSLGPRSHNYEINAMLRVSKYSEREIRQFFSNVFEVKQNRLNSDLHLTVYHARVPIPGLQVGSHTLDITVDTAETRFMVLVPGGENPHDDIDAGAHSVGIRLTKRNTAIPQIQKLREQIYRLESKAVIGNRKPTSAWTNCFGSRNYQPHIQLLRPWHKVCGTLDEIGKLFRNSVNRIEFDSFQVEARQRIDGQWIVGSAIKPRRVASQVITHQEAARLRNLLS